MSSGSLRATLLRQGDLAASRSPKRRITIVTRRPVGSFSRMDAQLTGPGDAGRFRYSFWRSIFRFLLPIVLVLSRAAAVLGNRNRIRAAASDRFDPSVQR